MGTEVHTAARWTVAAGCERRVPRALTGLVVPSYRPPWQARVWPAVTENFGAACDTQTNTVGSLKGSLFTPCCPPPAGTCLASGGGDSTVKIWDFERQRCTLTFTDHKQVG